MTRRTIGRSFTAAALLALACALGYFAHALPQPAQRSARRHHRPRSTPPPTVGAPAPSPIAPGTRLRVTFLAVGQGDAALLESGDGHAAMIDTGPPEGIDAVRNALASHAIHRLDWIILSHPHLDHIGGAQSVLDSVPVGRVIDPAYPHPIATYEHLLDRIQQLGIGFTRAQRGDAMDLGPGVRIDLFEPHAPFLQNTRSDVNANSVVARVTTGSVRVLFMGDAERETEARLLSDQTDLRAEVLKVAHHGSRFASTSPFLDAVAPRYAVISCGTGNDYGHPHRETLDALSSRHIEFHRTDLEGDVTLTTDGSTLSLTPTRAATDLDRMTPGAHARAE